MRAFSGSSHQRGNATVELAIALPLLLLMTLAVVDVGRMLSQYAALTSAIRNACRYVASNATLGSTGVVNITPELQLAAGNLVATGSTGGSGTALLPGLSASDVTVADSGSGYVSVTASYGYQPLIASGLPTFGLLPPISLAVTMRAQTVMRAF